jgi:cellulose synthase/poly-beta-1,6-N-acetylglucosamine synthase-like glycosyltransferase
VLVVVEIVFWLCAALIVWTQLGYPLALLAIDRLRGPAPGHSEPSPDAVHEPPLRSPQGGALPSSLPAVSLIVAAHDEQESIAAKVANALALDYPRELLQVIVACDGCGDATAERSRMGGADLVLELARGGKIRAQDAAVARARGEIVAFSDANSLLEPDALRALVAAFASGHDRRESESQERERGARRSGGPRRVGYACGQVRFVQAAHGAGATNQEGLYWRYEMALRARESRLSSITAGNGAIYATRREAYLVVDPIMGHDLSFPFNLVKRGWRAVYVPAARATEPMVPSIAGELARKRRMMSHTWPIVLRGGMLSPRGYPPGYALMILSHRVLRYATPFLHVLAFAANIAIVAADSKRSALYVATLTLQVALGAAAGLGGLIRLRPLLVARYYVLTTASIALGLWDYLRHGTSVSWEAAEGTRPGGAAGAVDAAPGRPAR